MHKVITFLGVLRPDPKPVLYRLGGETYAGVTFTRPLYQIAGRSTPVDRVIVFVTEKARETALPNVDLDRAILEPRDIPDGETSEELWQIFTALTDVVDRGDTVTFDITHGLRSLPFLVFLAAAYLRSAKDARIQAVYYGALDLSTDEGGTRVAPVIDLSEFVALLDWLVASDALIDTGNAGPLAKLLKEAADRPVALLKGVASTLTAGERREVAQRRGHLEKMQQAIEQASRALRLTLPDQAMEESSRLAARIQNAAEATTRWARPFAVLADRVAEAYTPLALASPRDPDRAIEALAQELAMVDWYCKRGLVVQAVTLGREWIVGWAMAHAGYPDAYDRRHREEVERSLSGAIQQQRRKEPSAPHSVPTGRSLAEIPEIERALGLFDQLGNLRNTLNHAGKRPKPESAEKLERHAHEYCGKLRELPLPQPEGATS